MIRSKVSGAVGLVLTILALLFFWHATIEYKTVIINAEKSSASYASALKEHAERVFTEADNSLKTLIDEIKYHGGISSTQSEQFYTLIKNTVSDSQYSSLFFVNTSGIITAHSKEFRVKPVKVADRDYFRLHLDNPTSGLFISKPFISRVSGTSRFSLSRPVHNADGSLAGLVVITYETSYFEKFYKSIELGLHGRTVLSTTGGDILITEPHRENPSPDDFASSTLFKTLLPAAPSGTHQLLSPLSGDMRIVSYNRLNHFPVVAIVSLNKTDVTAHWLSSSYKEGTVIFLLMVVIVLLSLLFLRQFKRLEETNVLLEMQQSDIMTKVELLDSASDAILLLDQSGRLVYFNNALCKITGYTREQLENRLIQEIEPPEYAEKVVENIQRLVNSGEIFSFESAYLHSAGHVVPVEVHAKRVEIHGQTYISSVVRDITEHKESDRKLSLIAREWQDTFNAVEDAVWLVDMDRKIIRANRSAHAIFGCESETLIGKQCQGCNGLLSSYDHCSFEAMIASKKRCNFQLQREGRWYEMTIDPVLDDKNRIINAVHALKDITELKKSELREHIRSEILERVAGGDKLDSLLSFIASAIEKERPGALCSILLVSEDGKRLVNGAAPSLPDAYNTAVHRTKIGEGSGSCGTAVFRKERMVVEDIATHPFWEGFTAAEEAGLRSCWSEPIRSSSGKILGTFAIYHRQPASPGYDEIRLIEQASTFAGIAIERRRAEKERAMLEEQLHQSQKMEAIGHLAGGMAHDFNNLLTPILVYAEMLKKVIPKNDEKAYEKLASIITASHMARDLTQQLLTFGRKQVMQIRPVDINEIVRSFHQIIRRTVSENIDIQLQISSQPQVINADRQKLEQVILNLAINAKDSFTSNGTIVIETGQVLLDDEYVRLHPELDAGIYALLSFTDSGCGMSEKTLQHIFDPFFTTKRVGQGTGSGWQMFMALSNSIKDTSK